MPDIIDNHLTVDMGSKLIAGYKNVHYKLIEYRQNGVCTDLLNSRSPSESEMNVLKILASGNGVFDIVVV